MLVNLLELCTISKPTDLNLIKRVTTWPKINWMLKLRGNKNEKDLSCFQIDVLLCTTSNNSKVLIDLTSNISWNSLSIKKQVTVLQELKILDKGVNRINNEKILILELYKIKNFKLCHKYTNSIWIASWSKYWFL